MKALQHVPSRGCWYDDAPSEENQTVINRQLVVDGPVAANRQLESLSADGEAAFDCRDKQLVVCVAFRRCLKLCQKRVNAQRCRAARIAVVFVDRANVANDGGTRRVEGVSPG